MATKQVIILRKDLNMRKGKMVAQGSHASMKIFFDLMKHKVKTGTSLDLGDLDYELTVTPEMKEWLEGSFTKICVGVNSEDELNDIYNKAKEMELPCSLIEDNGLTEFKGIKTKTAVAIGPAESEKIDLITSKLQLL